MYLTSMLCLFFKAFLQYSTRNNVFYKILWFMVIIEASTHKPRMTTSIRIEDLWIEMSYNRADIQWL